MDLKINQKYSEIFLNLLLELGSVQVLRHRVRGLGGPASIADTDDALRGGGGP